MRHNKKRNSALLYEFLIRHITNCLINDNKDEANKATLLSKKYFGKGTKLREELNLFNSVLNTNVKSRHSAHKVLGEVVRSASKMNIRELNDEKSRLIKEINHSFGGDKFYDYKIPNYKILASIQTLLTDGRNKKKNLNSIQKIQLEDHIVDKLLEKDKNLMVERLKVDPNYSNVVYKFVIEKFNKKYADKLNENQKKFLAKYAVYLVSENQGVLKGAVKKEIDNIKSKLSMIKDSSLREDKSVSKKLNDCYEKLCNTDFEEINEEKVLQLLQYMQLIEEVES